MNKKLIYYWYVPAVWDRVYDQHLKNIALYFHLYDFKEKLFVLSYDKGNQAIPAYLITVAEKIRGIVPDAKFMFYDNDPQLRDSKFFYDEIAMKLGEFDKDDVVFYAHAKGKYTNYIPSGATVIWNNLMYFTNLYDPNKIEEFINNKENLCFGSLCWDTTNVRMEHDEFNTQRYKWHYSGTIFWLKPYQIHEYIEQNNLTIPENSRYFSECFLGNVIPADDNKRIQNYGPYIFPQLHQFINKMPDKDRMDFIKIHNAICS